MKKNCIYIFVFICILSFLYLGAKSTYTSFESHTSTIMKAKTAGIHLKINGQDITSGLINNNVILENTEWTSSRTREGKISPGSVGHINLELDPTGSEVAIMYEFQFLDKKIDDDKLLNFSSIVSDDLVRISRDTYAGIITLNDLNNNKKINIVANFYFDYLTDIPGIEEDNQVLDDLFEIHFHAVQYNGDELVPYVEEGE